MKRKIDDLGFMAGGYETFFDVIDKRVAAAAGMTPPELIESIESTITVTARSTSEAVNSECIIVRWSLCHCHRCHSRRRTGYALQVGPRVSAESSQLLRPYQPRRSHLVENCRT